MKFSSFRHKLVFTISLFTVLLLVSIAAGTYALFRNTSRELIFSQQFFMVSEIAKRLDDEIASAHKALLAVAEATPVDAINNVVTIQKWLDERKGTQTIFNHGLFLLDENGTSVVSSSTMKHLDGTVGNFKTLYNNALSSGGKHISLPLPCSVNQHPIVFMTAPLRDSKGNIKGLLCGAIDLLHQDGFFNGLAQSRFGSSGYLYLFAADRTLIMHPDKSRIMKKDIKPGADTFFDMALVGFEGSGETGSSGDQHFLTSFKRLQSTGWILAANYPYQDAMKPISRFRNAFILGLLFFLFAAIIVARKLGSTITKPLSDLTDQIHQLARSDADREKCFLSTEHGEIGMLTDSFNALLHEVRMREDQLKLQADILEEEVTERQKSEKRLREQTDILLKNEKYLTEQHDELIATQDERLLLEQQFHHAQKLESLGVLAGGIAHDFNNILTVIVGQCYMAREFFDSEETNLKHIDGIENAAHRAAELCRQMLTYAGKSKPEQTLVNMRMLVDEIVKMLQSAIKKNVTIELNLSRNVPELSGDNALIQQIVMNLIINAADAIGDNNGSITISLTKEIITVEQEETDLFGTAISAGVYCCLGVVDSGCGMDEATQLRIFEPFFTTKFTGRGLGMSAILGIIKSHNGSLQLSSKPGTGTTFKVLFPLSNSLTADENVPTVTAVPSTPISGTIMLVEDEEQLLNIGRTMLERLGFSVVTAVNGSEALEIYHQRQGNIDVMLLDMIMPVMGGVELYHELRKLSTVVPVVICSGYGIEDVEGTIGQDEYAGFIQKPYRPEILLNVLTNMVNSVNQRVNNPVQA